MDGILTGTASWIRVNLGFMTMKIYSTLLRFLEVEPYHQIYSTLLRFLEVEPYHQI